MKKLLVVEDEPAQRLLLSDELRDAGFEVTEVDSGEAALETLATEEFDLMTLDMQMPGISGLEVLDEVSRRWPALPVIVCTAYGDKKQDFRTWAANDYWVKSDVVSELLEKINAALA
jgi:CheY-like chemotaxis protein